MRGSRFGPLAVALALALGGCGDDEGDAAAGAASGGGSGGVLTTVGYGGLVDDVGHETIGQPFAEQEGVQVRKDAPVDYSKIRAQVESGNVTWDVVKVEPFWAIANCGEFLEPIDTSKITTLDKLPDEGKMECGVPLDLFAYVMMYDEEKFGDDAPTSWADFFDTEKYPGKRGVWNYAVGQALEGALLADGVAPEDLYPLDLDRAFKKLDTIRDDIVFYDTGAIQTEQMEARDVVMTVAWSARAVDAIKNGAPFAPVWNGHMLMYDTLVIPKGSKQVELAHKYMSFATDVPQQEAFLERMPYGAANEDAQPNLGEIEAKFYLNDPEIHSQGTFIDQQWWAENFEAASDAWTKWASS